MTYRQQQIRAIEQGAIEQGISGDEMMRRAGASAFNFLVQKWPQARSLLLFCGSGNNGGDGYVMARLARVAGLTVTVRYLGDPDQMSGEAHRAFNACRQAYAEVKPFDPDETFDEVDLVVDALLGIGLKGALREEAVVVINFMNQLDCPLLSVDIPSGLQADEGTALGEVVKAEATVTFIGVKVGMTLNQGPECCGEVVCYTLDLPEALYAVK